MSNVFQQELVIVLQRQQKCVQQATDFLKDNGECTKEKLLNGYKLKASLDFCAEEINKIDNRWMKLLFSIKDDEKLAKEQAFYESCAITSPDPNKIPYLIALHQVEEAIAEVETAVEMMEEEFKMTCHRINFAALKLQARVFVPDGEFTVASHHNGVEHEIVTPNEVAENEMNVVETVCESTVSPCEASSKADPLSDEDESLVKADAFDENLKVKSEDYAQVVEVMIPEIMDEVGAKSEDEKIAKLIEENPPMPMENVPVLKHYPFFGGGDVGDSTKLNLKGQIHVATEVAENCSNASTITVINGRLLPTWSVVKLIFEACCYYNNKALVFVLCEVLFVSGECCLVLVNYKTYKHVVTVAPDKAITTYICLFSVFVRSLYLKNYDSFFNNLSLVKFCNATSEDFGQRII